MKNLFLTVFFTLVSVFSFSQQISVRVTELKDFVSSENLTANEMMKVANFDSSSVRTVDGSYEFDLVAKTVSFKTRKSSGTSKVISSTEKNGIFTIVYEDSSVEGNKMNVTMVINPEKNKVFFTYRNPINNYTLAQDFTETQILVNK